jgi:glycine oxidase
MNRSDIDAVVVGAGIAGALLRFRLHRAGLKVTWVDQGLDDTATQASAGIMNPVTGRRYSWSWRFDAMLQEALAEYGALEQASDMRLLFRRSLWRSLFTDRDQEQWTMRMGEEPYRSLMQAPLDGTAFPFLRNAPSMGGIDPVWQVDLPAAVEAVARVCGPWSKGNWLPERTLLLEDGGLIHLPDTIPVFLCLGSDPWPQLPLKPFKGEALIIRTNDLPRDMIIHHKLKVVPLAHDRFWVGSRDSWDWPHPGPEPEARIAITHSLDLWYDIRYEVESALAGIRPSSERRRPFAGPLPGKTNLWILNGLGTKGASLAPLVAGDLVRQFLGEDAGDPELRWPWLNRTDPATFPDNH